MPEFPKVRVLMEKGAVHATAVLTNYGEKWGAAVEIPHRDKLENREAFFATQAEALAEAKNMWEATLG
ncbi:MAG: hypothetical protein EOO23_08890 [Comamonadaceae bacterium]|nr:MAG: hypothetical protein EOO23_08890 [Comamonadaceae bacterium]